MSISIPPNVIPFFSYTITYNYVDIYCFLAVYSSISRYFLRLYTKLIQQSVGNERRTDRALKPLKRLLWLLLKSVWFSCSNARTADCSIWQSAVPSRRAHICMALCYVYVRHSFRMDFTANYSNHNETPNGHPSALNCTV